MLQRPDQPYLILASTSPYRARALEQLSLDFKQLDPKVDEAAFRGIPPAEQARTLAELKATATIAQNPEAWVIAADQTGECEGLQLHKPGDKQTAVDQLMLMRGCAIKFHSAVSVAVADQVRTMVVATDLSMRDLPLAAIEAYVAADEPYDCAGGFKAEALGIALFESVVSDDPSALIGLPLIALTSLLGQFGYDVLGSTH